MADNTTLNTGSGGDTISTDDLGTVKVQRVKVQYGVDGSATDVSDTNPLPIDDAGGSLTVDGTVTANLSATDNAVLDQIEVNTSYGDNTGGGVEAGALRVTLANDSTGVLSVDDNGGSLTVDGTVTANLSATDNAVLDNIQTAVEIVDNAVFADDAAFTLASSSVMVSGAIRDDSLTTLTAVEGDAVPLRVSSTGALHVTGGGGGTEYNEDAATPATITGTATMMERDDALSTLTPIEGDWAAMRCDSQGALWVNAVNADGTSNVDTAAGATDAGAVMLAVRDDSLTTLTPADGDYTTLRVSSTGALHVTGGGGGTEYVVDAAAPAAPTGTASLMERDDALAALTEIEGDWTNMRSNANGALWTAVDGTVTVDGSGVTQPVSGTVTANLSATDNAVLDQIELNTSYGDNTGNGTAAGALRVTVASDTTGVLSIDDNGGSITIDGTVTANAGTGTMTVDLGANNDIQGQVAHDAAVSGNPLIAGARATNSVEGITQVANGDATRLQADLNGVLLTRPHTTPEEQLSERVSDTGGTSTAFTTFAAGGAGIHNYVTDITVLNTSATDGYVDIRDGTAGSVIWTLPLPANGGATHSFSLPLKGAANTALAYDVSAALTTVYISVNGFQAQG